jgi:VWFA-related protein
MKPRQASLIDASVALAEASNPQDQIFVVNFNEKVKLGLPESVPFTDDIQLLRKSLAMQRPEGQTALYDAIAVALQHLESGNRERKALVVISDGDDNRSTHTLKETMRLIEGSEATIYTVGLVDPNIPDQKLGVLKQISAVSGGECFLPPATEPIRSICQRIAQDIRNRYTIGYHPQRTSDKAAVRTIRVTAQSPEHKKLIVHTRTTYRLPERP